MYLSEHFEEKDGEEIIRLIMSDTPKDLLAHQIDNIVAFKIAIDKVTAKSKLSQNKTPVDVENVARVMAEMGKSALADRMKKL